MYHRKNYPDYKYRLAHCHECYTKNKTQGNKTKIANIAQGKAECHSQVPSALFFICVLEVRQYMEQL